MFQAWAAAGRPAYADVATGTSESLIPLAEEEVEGFIQGVSFPSSSLQIDAFISSLENISADDFDLYRQPIMAGWIAMSGFPVDEQPEITGAGLEGITNILDHVVEVATYLGAAGVGGIVGNRADAVAVKSVKHLFAKVRERWLSRRPAGDESLSRDEASDAARAAATALGHSLESLTVRTAEQRDDGSWLLILDARGRGSAERLRVTVPTGDPGRAAIFVLPDFSPRTFAANSAPSSSDPPTKRRTAARLPRRIISRMFGHPMEGWPRAKNPWFCIYCGWKCTERHNQTLCRSCGQPRPLVMGSVTMQRCLRCHEFSLAMGSYCEWCGTPLPSEPA
jgi:hypothetical protein